MAKITNVAELRAFRENCKKELDSQTKKILVCAGTGCIAGGSLNIYKKLEELCKKNGLNVKKYGNYWLQQVVAPLFLAVLSYFCKKLANLLKIYYYCIKTFSGEIYGRIGNTER